MKAAAIKLESEKLKSTITDDISWKPSPCREKRSFLFRDGQLSALMPHLGPFLNLKLHPDEDLQLPSHHSPSIRGSL